MEYLLHTTLATLAAVPGSTLLGVQRILSDEAYRRRILCNVEDPILLSFWKHEFPNFRGEAIGPIQNKVGQLLSRPPIRYMLGQKKCSFDLRHTIDNNRIFIANLSKGSIGEDSADLLGALLVSGFQVAAMERAEVPEVSRQPFYLYIDEFQDFTTSSISSVFSESRKYGLCLTISHQYLDQLPLSIGRSIFGNVGTIISFRVGYPDARHLSRAFGETFLPHDFTRLARYHIYLRLAINGEMSAPFSATTLPPGTPLWSDRKHKIIRQSQERFGSSRETIERQIRSWYHE